MFDLGCEPIVEMQMMCKFCTVDAVKTFYFIFYFFFLLFH